MEFVEPRSEGQRALLDSIKSKIITYGVGPSGTGKSFLALSEAIRLLKHKKIKRIVCMRPLIAERKIEQSLGALPGIVLEKVTPYACGLLHNLTHLVGESETNAMIEKGYVQFEAISLMRGASFRDSFLIVDEAQLLDRESGAMKLILTRLGENTKIVILGDVLQSMLDIQESDMVDAIRRTRHLKEVGVVFLSEPEDIQRSPIVRRILECYNDIEKFQEAMRVIGNI